MVWSSVAVMAAMAISAHFLLDTGTNPNRKTRIQFSSSILIDDVEQETIGMIYFIYVFYLYKNIVFVSAYMRNGLVEISARLNPKRDLGFNS